MKKKFYREAHGYKTDEEMINTLRDVKVEIPKKEPVMEKLEKEVIEEIIEEPKKEGKKKNGRKFII